MAIDLSQYVIQSETDKTVCEIPGNTPAYQERQVVYVKESAALGNLEAVVITGIERKSGKWHYNIARNANLRLGDRASYTNGRTILYSEEELITYQEALDYAQANLVSQLNDIESKQEAQNSVFYTDLGKIMIKK